jgi:DNA-binding NtrC family response regulator
MRLRSPADGGFGVRIGSPRQSLADASRASVSDFGPSISPPAGEVPDLLGESPAIENVRDTIRRLGRGLAAGTRCPAILITGATGTGKGLVSRLLHRVGPRCRGPFVDVNCAAIPETLLEAELFGFERGAFTDAGQSKPGLFQVARGGTLFLDEIALLGRPLQAKLLTAVETRAVRRLGATRSEPVDTWIISATNADLRGAVQHGQFREDLYHRLAVVTLALPVLRDRGEDILILAEHFLERVCRNYGLPSHTLGRDARRWLLAYSWPGNVRELANVIERAVLLAESSELTPAVLAPPRARPVGAASAGRPAASRGLEAARRAPTGAVLGWPGPSRLSRTPRTWRREVSP